MLTIQKRRSIGAGCWLGPKLGFSALATVGMLLVGARPAHAGYMFTNIINNNDVTFNQALGINDAGTITGYFGSGTSGHPNKGYTVVSPYGQTNFKDENFPGSSQTQVTGINNLGVTVGFWSNANLGIGMDSDFGFTDVGGTFTSVDNPNSPSSTTPVFNNLLGINSSNIAVGFYTDTTGINHGYTYSIATKTFSANIDDPNAGSGAGQGTTAAGINNSGVIVGFYVNAAGDTRGFIDNYGAFTTIDPDGSSSAQLLGINDNGLAVGDYTDAQGILQGLLYNLNTGTYLTLDDPNAGIAGGQGTTLNGINDLDQLVGFYVDNAGNNVGLIANSVPEPASLGLLAVGLLGLMFVRRRPA